MQSDNFGLFYGVYEFGGEFEPIIAFLLKSRQFVFQKLFLIDEFVFGFSVFGEVVGPKTRQKLNELYVPGTAVLTEIQNQAPAAAQLDAQIKELQEKILQLTEQINQLLKQRGLIP